MSAQKTVRCVPHTHSCRCGGIVDHGGDPCGEPLDFESCPDCTEIPQPGRLHLGRDAGGPRHYLDGQPVHCGAGLEMKLRSGQWIPVRYEASLWDRRINVSLYAEPWGPDDPQAIVEYPLAQQLRWPIRTRGRA